MTIFETSMLLTRGNNTHTQLRYIVNHHQDFPDKPEFQKMIRNLEMIYQKDCSHENYHDLKVFLVQHSETIFSQYIALMGMKEDNNFYDLKG